MAVDLEGAPVTTFDQWYVERAENPRTNAIEFRGLEKCGSALISQFKRFKNEMDARCSNYDKLEKLMDAEVISPKDDLPNVSSGEIAGLIRRMARNMVQHCPNVEIISKFDDDSPKGIFARHILLNKIIGSDTYSNDMQQNLFASTMLALGLGFDCVVPCLLQDALGSWYMKYDTIHYRDVFPEPGAKNVREATEVYVRRYLTRGELLALIREQPAGWDIPALRKIAENSPQPPARESQSNSHQDTKRRVIAEGYEIVTWYNSGGRPFLTFSPSTGLLLRIEENLDPLKRHPVHFLILEKDSSQPLGKSQVELVLGRQEFQDLMLNGAMKLWYRNINPAILGFGAAGAVPNLSPGKYTQISNPNAKIQPFEVSTQTLLQYQAITQGNLGSMVNLVGAADQQMAASAGGGMSATPQGVDAQQQMVDITTNNYQKAIEAFFGRYCSYALTVYFQELKHVKKVAPNADARQQLIAAGLKPENFNEDGSLDMDFSDMATEYFVRCVPGSLVELEDEKQARILGQLFVPLSQAMPALAATQDMQLLRNAAATMQYIMQKQIELSGSKNARDLKLLFTTGRTQEFTDYETRAQTLEDSINGVSGASVEGLEHAATAIKDMQDQMGLMRESQNVIMRHLGMPDDASAEQPNNSEEPVLQNAGAAGNV